MESLKGVALCCRAEGYRQGLSGEWCFLDTAIDRVLAQANGLRYDATYHPFGSASDEFQELLQAMRAGLGDGYLSYAKESGIFLSPEQAAEAKGVATNTIYRLLRNPKRVERFFERSTYDGDGKRRVWYLHPSDVKAWKPDARGRKRAYPDAGLYADDAR